MKRPVALILSLVLLCLLALPVAAQDDYFEHVKQAAEGTPDSAAPSRNETTQLADGLSIPNYSFLQDGDFVVVYGEVVNTTPGDKLVPEIQFTFLDEAGNPYLTSAVAANNDFIAEGQRLGFQGNVIETTLRVGDWHSVQVTAGPLPSFDLEYFDLSDLVIADVAQSGPVLDGLAVAGRIVNTGEQPLLVSEIVIEYRDSAGVFAGSCSYALEATVPPGQFVRFSFELYESGNCEIQYPAVEASSGPPFTYSLILHRFPNT